MKKQWIVILVLSLIAATSGVAFGGQIGLGDFVSPTVEGFTGLGLPFDNFTPYVLNGNTYTTDDTRWRYTDWDCCITPPGFGEGFGNNTEFGYIDVVLNASYQKVGGWIGGSLGDVLFYDSADNLVGTISMDGSGARTEWAFFAWEDAGGIGRVRFTDESSNGTILILDDLTYEDGGVVIPEPSTAGLVLAGVLAAAALRRRRSA